MNLKLFAKNTKKIVKKHASSGLTILAVMGVVITAVCVAKETPEANERFEENKDASTAEKFGIFIGSYPKSLISGGCTIGCIFGAHFLDHKEITTLSALVATQYKNAVTNEKVKNKVLDEEEKEKLNTGLIDEYLFAPDECAVIRTGNGNILCREPITGHLFTSSQDYIVHCQTTLNSYAQKKQEDYIDVSDWFDALGLPQGVYGDNHGFPFDPNDSSTGIDVTFGSGHTSTGVPYLAIEYYNMPIEI